MEKTFNEIVLDGVYEYLTSNDNFYNVEKNEDNVYAEFKFGENELNLNASLDEDTENLVIETNNIYWGYYVSHREPFMDDDIRTAVTDAVLKTIEKYL